MQVKDYFSRIKEIEGKINNLSCQKAELCRQLRHAMQVEFEEEHGIKQGDKLKTIDGKYYYYDSVLLSPLDTMYVLCHPAKRDGTPGKAFCHLCEEDLLFNQ